MPQTDLARLTGRTGEVVPAPTEPPGPGPLARLSGYMQDRVARAGRMTQGPFHAPGGIDQAAGGASGLATPMAWVGDPSAPLFSYLRKFYPKMAAAVERSPVEFRFPTQGRTVDELARSGAPGVEAMGRLPGEMPWVEIAVDAARARPTTVPHEVIHGLYDAKTMGTAEPPVEAAGKILDATSAAVRNRILERYELTPDPFFAGRLARWGGAPSAHVAVQALAEKLWKGAGYPLTPPLP